MAGRAILREREGYLILSTQESHRIDTPTAGTCEIAPTETLTERAGRLTRTYSRWRRPVISRAQIRILDELYFSTKQPF